MIYFNTNLKWIKIRHQLCYHERSPWPRFRRFEVDSTVFVVILTLHIKVHSSLYCFAYSIVRPTPVFACLIPGCFQVQSISFTHSLPIFHPFYLWLRVTNGRAMEYGFIGLSYNLVDWLLCKTWWIWNLGLRIQFIWFYIRSFGGGIGPELVKITKQLTA